MTFNHHTNEKSAGRCFQNCSAASGCHQAPSYFVSFCSPNLKVVASQIQDDCSDHTTAPKTEEREKASLCLSLFFIREETQRSFPKRLLISLARVGHMTTPKGAGLWISGIKNVIMRNLFSACQHKWFMVCHLCCSLSTQWSLSLFQNLQLACRLK